MTLFWFMKYQIQTTCFRNFALKASDHCHGQPGTAHFFPNLSFATYRAEHSSAGSHGITESLLEIQIYPSNSVFCRKESQEFQSFHTFRTVIYPMTFRIQGMMVSGFLLVNYPEYPNAWPKVLLLRPQSLVHGITTQYVAHWIHNWAKLPELTGALASWHYPFC